MIYQIYSIEDRCCEFYAPRIFTNEKVAIRDFSIMVNHEDPQNILYTHPGDFNLYLIGEFDASNGLIFGRDIPKFIISGASVKKGESDEDEK